MAGSAVVNSTPSKRKETSRENVKQQRLATPYAHAGRFCGTSLRDAFARRRYLFRKLANHRRQSRFMPSRIVRMDQILSGGAIEQPRGHPIGLTRLLGRRRRAHPLERGPERGALGAVAHVAGAPLAHGLLRGPDSRPPKAPRWAGGSRGERQVR